MAQSKFALRSVDLAEGLPWQRLAIAGVSLVGLAAMAAVALRQTGVVSHLPDPAIKGFDSDKVNMSSTAFPLGIPDGLIGFASYGANVPLALVGGRNRACDRPWLPIALSGKAAVDTLVSAWYLYQMPTREKAWCGYCITAAIASFATLALSLPEALAAGSEWRSGRGHG